MVVRLCWCCPWGSLLLVWVHLTCLILLWNSYYLLFRLRICCFYPKKLSTCIFYPKSTCVDLMQSIQFFVIPNERPVLLKQLALPKNGWTKDESFCCYLTVDPKLHFPKIKVPTCCNKQQVPTCLHCVIEMLTQEQAPRILTQQEKEGKQDACVLPYFSRGKSGDQ